MDETAEDVYAAPETLSRELRAGSDSTSQLASRTQRVAGFLLDSVIVNLPTIPLFLSFSIADVMARGQAPLSVFTEFGAIGVAVGATNLALAGLNIYLIVTRGQSLGKIAVRSRITRLDGTSVGFVDGVLLRSWIITGIAFGAAWLSQSTGSLWPSQLFGLLNLINLGMGLFRSDRRCGHDLIAGTRVIDLRAHG